jgi:hypothetical protein
MKGEQKQIKVLGRRIGQQTAPKHQYVKGNRRVVEKRKLKGF